MADLTAFVQVKLKHLHFYIFSMCHKNQRSFGTNSLWLKLINSDPSRPFEQSATSHADVKRLGDVVATSRCCHRDYSILMKKDALSSCSININITIVLYFLSSLHGLVCKPRLNLSCLKLTNHFVSKCYTIFMYVHYVYVFITDVLSFCEILIINYELLLRTAARSSVSQL